MFYMTKQNLEPASNGHAHTGSGRSGDLEEKSGGICPSEVRDEAALDTARVALDSARVVDVAADSALDSASDSELDSKLVTVAT